MLLEAVQDALESSEDEDYATENLSLFTRGQFFVLFDGELSILII